jgi:hypothetical protein
MQKDVSGARSLPLRRLRYPRACVASQPRPPGASCCLPPRMPRTSFASASAALPSAAGVVSGRSPLTVTADESAMFRMRVPGQLRTVASLSAHEVCNRLGAS